MGIAILAAGTILLIFGCVILGFALLSETDDWDKMMLGALVVSLPLIFGGSLLFRKHDKDVKKE